MAKTGSLMLSKVTASRFPRLPNKNNKNKDLVASEFDMMKKKTQIGFRKSVKSRNFLNMSVDGVPKYRGHSSLASNITVTEMDNQNDLSPMTINRIKQSNTIMHDPIETLEHTQYSEDKLPQEHGRLPTNIHAGYSY